LKLVNFKYKNKDDDEWGILNQDGNILSIGRIIIDIVYKLDTDRVSDDELLDLLGYSTLNFSQDDLDGIIKNIKSFDIDLNSYHVSLNEIFLLSPIEQPVSLRDAYAFRQHVEAGRRSRGLDMIPEYDKFPVFYYGNHNAIGGPGEVQIQKDQAIKLDYELEIAVVIGKEGKNLSIDEADDYIMGYTIMNDLSARALQKEEMKLSLGPAKGKDFLTTLGPYIVTKDELEDKLIQGSDGDRYDLNMKAYLNGKLLSQDNFKNITWTFAQIISRISNGVTIYPGDVIGSGTCATGCLLELNQTNNTDIWLQDGDEIKLEVDRLGSLVNTIKFI